MTTPLEEALERLVNRVPEVTLVFWILKILATTVGETAGDVLSITFKLGTVLTSYVMGALLLITLGIQFRARRYVPWIYWLVVVFISVVGCGIFSPSGTRQNRRHDNESAASRTTASNDRPWRDFKNISRRYVSTGMLGRPQIGSKNLR